MFVGHAAIAALAGAARPHVPLLPLVLAAYAADILEIGLHAVGYSHDTAMLWSHSISAMLAGGTIAALVTLLTIRRRDVAALVGLVYLSHWACDLLTGEGKPTWAGGPTFGFGLYDQPAADFAIEVALVLLAAAAYQWRRPRRRGRVAVATAVLVALQLGFNLGDRTRLKGLKRDLVRASAFVIDSAPGRRDPS